MGDYCLDLGAEILTRRGWKRHDEILIGEEVLAFNGATTKWTPLLGVYRTPTPLPFKLLSSKSFRMRCTDGHSWWTTHCYEPTGTVPQKRRLEELKTHHRILIAAPLGASSATSPLTAEQAAILGWICSDGHLRTIGNGVNSCIVQGKEPYRTMLRRDFADWFTDEYISSGISTFNLKAARMRELFEVAGIELCKGYKASLPALVATMKSDARFAFLQALLFAEGWQERGRWRFSQLPGPVLDAFQIGATLEGWRLGRGKINKNGVYTTTIVRQTPVDVANLSVVPDGEDFAWCPTTKFGSWVCRWKGTITITGNCDFASPSNRQRLASADLYDTATNVIELASDKLTKELYERVLKPTRDRWLGMLEGHHFYQYAAGETTDMHLCTMLRTQHLGSCAYVRLVFEDKNSKIQRQRGRDRKPRLGHVTLWVHHGMGSGKRASAPLNNLDQLPIYWDADIYLMGHQSKKVAAPLQRVLPVWGGKGPPHLQHRTIFIACTGSFSKAYIPGNRHGRVPRGDYVEKAMLNPAALGGLKIKIVPRWIHESNVGLPKGSRHWQPEISIEQ